MSVDTARLKKNSSGVWEVHWSEKGADRHYSRRVSTRTRSRIEAESFLTAFVTGQQRIAETIVNPTINDLISRYESALDAKGVSETQHICLRHLEKALGHLLVSDINDKKLLAYRKARRVSDGTLRRELGTLRAVLGHALKYKLIRHDDAPHIELPRQSEARTVYLNEVERKEFLELALNKGSSRLARFVALALLTGARRQAILGLKWSSVDMVGGYIDYRDMSRAKHNKRRVPVPMSATLKDMMQQYYDNRTSDYVLDHTGPIRNDWEKWIETTPYKHVHIHDMRRTFITLLLMKGAPVNTVAALVGDNPQTILAHYAQYVPTSGASVIGLLDD